MNYNILYVLLSFFYIGSIKIAPGTISSLITASIWYFLDFSTFLDITITLFIGIMGFALCYKYSKYNKDKDPSFIVIDEVVGMSIALLMMPKEYYLFFLSFFIFRLFDIFKPGIISSSEKIENGIGIMLDDILAGSFTFFIMHLLINWIF